MLEFYKIKGMRQSLQFKKATEATKTPSLGIFKKSLPRVPSTQS